MTIRRLAGISLLAVLAGCNQTENAGNMGVTADSTQQAQQQQAAVIQGSCPQIYLRDGTAVLRRSAKGAKDDPSKLLYQVTLADTTRRCVMNESQLQVTVMAQGRVVMGPAGTAGSTVKLPIRVAATDEKQTLYSQLVQFDATIPADTGSGQFIFTHNLTLPGGSGNFTKLYMGFDEGPYNTK